MEQLKEAQLKSTTSEKTIEVQNETPAPSRGETVVHPQMCGNNPEKRASSPISKGLTNVNYVYAIGKIEPRFPALGLEKEYVQVRGMKDGAGQTTQQIQKAILEENRYLARQMCWVMTIEGVETYILRPRHPEDFNLLVETVRDVPKLEDIDVVIGVRGPIAQPEMCNGLMIPIVLFDTINSFDINELIKSIPRPDGISEKDFEPAAREVIRRIMQMADNVGATDEHRALNYLSMRYKAIYANTFAAYGRNSELTNIEVLPSRLSDSRVRKIVDVVFTYTNRSTDVNEKLFVRVDVTEEFPFLVTKMSPYYDR